MANTNTIASLKIRRALNRRFRGMWYTFFLKTGPLDKRCFCCHKPASKRCFVNTWGTVGCYDFCPVHARRYRNKNIDSVDPDRAQ